MKTKASKQTETQLAITPPNFGMIAVEIVGMTPYVQARFGPNAFGKMEAKMSAGDQDKKRVKREARDWEADYKDAIHVSNDGWHGIPAAGIKRAMLSACRVAGIEMKKTKLCVFVIPDGVAPDGTALVKITSGKPRQIRTITRNANRAPDIRVRAMWEKWSARIQIRFDGDYYTTADVVNLLLRAGQQVGLGEGRHDSPGSSDGPGMGWGEFTISGKAGAVTELRSAKVPTQVKAA